MDADGQETRPGISETERVAIWRLEELIKAGYPVRAAEKIAASDADLHKAIELLQRGCHPLLAVRILT